MALDGYGCVRICLRAFSLCLVVMTTAWIYNFMVRIPSEPEMRPVGGRAEERASWADFGCVVSVNCMGAVNFTLIKIVTLLATSRIL